MSPHTHDHHNHGHDHEHSHSHGNLDYGEMYKQPWVQAMVKQIQDCLVANAEWLGIDPEKEQKVLDYACGHGTISLGVLKASPKAMCRGVDLDASQAERYNDEASKLQGDDAGARMLGIQGDLYHPSNEMTGAEWENFDMAIISMALHHVKDPVEMLRRLKERLRPGGTLVVVEFLGKEENAGNGRQYDPKDMVDVHSNQKIWPGFTTGSLEADLTKAGLEGFEVRVLDQPAQIPASMRGSFGGEQWPFFAKVRVPGKA